ncbi:hypothetical protein N431DRAFT_205971 [Stipitochalara longipes BDJ]|nr:hypothetical protein N431DRAFT_205971 [Stipitochalara longipes BDJ]
MFAPITTLASGQESGKARVRWTRVRITDCPDSDGPLGGQATGVRLPIKGAASSVACIRRLLGGLGRGCWARLENESHVADACPCCVVGALACTPSQSRPHDAAPSILCKRQHANSKLLTLQVSVHLGTLRLLTGARGCWSPRLPLQWPPSPPVPVALASPQATRALCRLTSPGWADLRCCTCGRAVFPFTLHASRSTLHAGSTR